MQRVTLDAIDLAHNILDACPSVLFQDTVVKARLPEIGNQANENVDSMQHTRGRALFPFPGRIKALAGGDQRNLILQRAKVVMHRLVDHSFGEPNSAPRTTAR